MHLQPRTLSSLYSYIQQKHFGWRLSRQQRFFEKFVISIGNVTVGGSAKTPFSIFLLQKCVQKKIPTLVVLRGYKGKKTRVGALVNADSTAEDVGDEALEIYESLCCAQSINDSQHSQDMCFSQVSQHADQQRNSADFRIAIGRDRARVIKKYGGNASLVILDDALQNPSIYHDLELTLVDMDVDYQKEELLPFGRLREPLSALSRADAIFPVWSHSPVQKDWQTLQKISSLSKLSKRLPDFFLQKSFQGWGWAQGSNQGAGRLPRHSCAVMCAIARPHKFVRDVAKTGRKIVCQKIFPDHHHFRVQDILALFHEAGPTCDFIVTQKDWMKLREIYKACLFQSAPRSRLEDASKIRDFFQRLFILRQGIEMANEEVFWQWLWGKWQSATTHSPSSLA